MRGLTHEQRAARRELWAREVEAGATFAQVCRKHRVSLVSVREACRALGVRPPPAAPPTRHASSFAILARLLRGERGVDIAADFGVSRQRVDQIRSMAEKAGIAVPR